MNTGFVPGTVIQAKTKSVGLIPSERAEIIRYDGDGFYIVKTSRSSAWVVHENDVELVMHADCDNRGGACSHCRSGG